MKDAKLAEHLASLTPARINVARAGTRPRTDTWLAFRRDHALARDAVLSNLDENFIALLTARYDLPIIGSEAKTREEFVLSPPSGKRISAGNLEQLNYLPRDLDVQIVIADGLSAKAVEENILDLYPMLLHGLKQKEITCGKAVVVKQGRVAVADQIAHHLGAKVAINLLGERPGLSTAESLSAYITFNPGPATISSDRTVVSNIHKGGTPPLEAGALIVKLVERILANNVSGVKLQALG